MVAVPEPTPPTRPPEAVAIAALELDQVPPDVPSIKVISDPTQTAEGPEIVPAVGLEPTVIVAVVSALPQPLVVTEYVIVALPAPTGVTSPELLIVAMAVLLQLQVPPLTVSDKEPGVPRQNAVAPLMIPAEATALTVTGKVATAVPQLLVNE